MKKILLIIIFISFVACTEKKESESVPDTKQVDTKLYKDFNIDPSGKSGAITATMTKNDLIEKFGESNLSDEKIVLAEGSPEVDATIVFEGTENELTVIWSQNGNPAALVFDKPGSKWDVYGIKIGLPIGYLQEINGVPFEFYGFDWENGGMVFNWNRGDLARMLENDKIYLGFGKAAAEEKNINIEKYTGSDVKLSSFDTKLNPLNIFVSKAEIVF